MQVTENNHKKIINWEADSAQTIVLGIHGLGAHGIWFDRLATRLEKRGISFASFDLKGFGAGSNGHIDSYTDWVSECTEIYLRLKHKNPNKKIIILGHSLGAIIASAMKLGPEDGLILSVPGFKGHPRKFKFWNFVVPTAIKYMSYKLFDRYGIRDAFYMKLPDPEHGNPTMTDPLRTSRVSANLVIQILKLVKVSKNNIGKIPCPTLVIQIAGDDVVSNETMNEWFKKLGNEVRNTDKKMHIQENTFHDWIWYDSVDPISDEIARWIKAI